MINCSTNYVILFIYSQSHKTRELHIFFSSCHLRHWGTLCHWSYRLALLAVDATACADASHWLMQGLYPPVGAKAVLSPTLFLFFFLQVLTENPPPALFSPICYFYSFSSVAIFFFCFTSICITSFKFAFELSVRPSLLCHLCFWVLLAFFFSPSPLLCVKLARGS